MTPSENISITYISKKGRLPRLPFLAMKDKILGKKYELSIVVATPALSKKLNNQFRDKNYPTNILSFPLTENSGEIILELEKIKKDAPEFDLSNTKFTQLLLIHGMLHLKGMEHSSTMEAQESKWMKYFSV